jgi:hypothetical protein
LQHRFLDRIVRQFFHQPYRISRCDESTVPIAIRLKLGLRYKLTP